MLPLPLRVHLTENEERKKKVPYTQKKNLKILIFADTIHILYLPFKGQIIFVPTTTYLRNNKSFISSSRWILAVLEFEPSARQWGGGGRMLGSSPTRSVPYYRHSFRYPAPDGFWLF